MCIVICTQGYTLVCMESRPFASTFILGPSYCFPPPHPNVKAEVKGLLARLGYTSHMTVMSSLILHCKSRNSEDAMIIMYIIMKVRYILYIIIICTYIYIYIYI